jgi:hypothetical protein
MVMMTPIAMRKCDRKLRYSYLLREKPNWTSDQRIVTVA